MKDILIQQGVNKTLFGKAKKHQKTENSEWKEMDAKAINAICLNLSDEVIHNVVDEENAETIWMKLEFSFGERFDKYIVCE
jgi:hypothetical protein